MSNQWLHSQANGILVLSNSLHSGKGMPEFMGMPKCKGTPRSYGDTQVQGDAQVKGDARGDARWGCPIRVLANSHARTGIGGKERRLLKEMPTGVCELEGTI